MNFFFYNSQTVRNLPLPYINFLSSCLKMELNQTTGKCPIRAIKMHQDLMCHDPKEYLLTSLKDWSDGMRPSLRLANGGLPPKTQKLTKLIWCQET